MGYYLLKIVVSAVLIVVIAEVSKRNTFLGGLLASFPIVSLMAFVWLYIDTNDLAKVQELSTSVFWLVLPSLALFLLLPLCIMRGLGFWTSLVLSVTGTGFCYLILIFILKKQVFNL